MTTKKETFDEIDRKRGLQRLRERPKERLTCLKCKNQTFLLIFGVADFPFFDTICSQCGSGYPLGIGK